MKTLGLVLFILAVSTHMVPPAFAQLRDPIGPYAAPEGEQGSTSSRGADPGEVQSRGGLRDPIGPYAAPEGEEQQPSSEEVQGRGLTDKLKGKALDLKRQPQPGGAPPAHLCRTETKMLSQCKCFTATECQPLTTLFPNSCPAGSQHCEFVPMSQGAMPPLPPNLCGYQVPLSVTECSCSNAADCRLLSPFCPGACPTGSQSCTCRPMRRG
jgi:hypothetical protein